MLQPPSTTHQELAQLKGQRSEHYSRQMQYCNLGSGTIMSVLRPHIFFFIFCAEHVKYGSQQQTPKIYKAANINPLIATLKPHSNGPSYSNIVIGTLAVDGWTVTFGTARKGLGRGPGPPRSLFAVPNVTAHHHSVHQLHIIQCSIVIAFGV